MMSLLPVCLAAALVGSATVATEEVRGRTWDRLAEVRLPDEDAHVKPLTAAEIAALGGRQIPICMIGDSITWAQKGDYWRKWLVGDVPAVAFVGSHTGMFGYSHAGEGGNSTSGVLRRIDNPERVPDAPYYHLMIGINDSSAAKSAEVVPAVAKRTADALERIVERLLARPCTRKVFVAAIMPCSIAKQPYRDVAGSAANVILRERLPKRFPGDRVVWIEYEYPMRAVLKTWRQREDFGDWLHPRKKGYKVMADLFAPILLREAAPPMSPSVGRGWGVRVENFWDETTRLTRPLIPGWYVLSFDAPKGVGALKVRLWTESEKMAVDKRLEVAAYDGRRELEFMTGYQGYGYSESPFHLEVTDATGAPVDVARVQVEKMRPTRHASVYGRGVFVDGTSPIAPGEHLVALDVSTSTP